MSFFVYNSLCIHTVIFSKRYYVRDRLKTNWPVLKLLGPFQSHRCGFNAIGVASFVTYHPVCMCVYVATRKS